MRKAILAALAMLAACQQPPTARDDEAARPPVDYAAFAESCFGIEAPIALGMMAVQGGAATPTADGACQFTTEDGQVVAALSIGPASEVASREAALRPAAQAFLDVARDAKEANAEVGGRLEPITLKKRGGVEEAVPLAIRGFGAGGPDGVGDGEMALLYAGHYAYVRFFGREERAARRFMEQQALPALRRAEKL